MMIKTYNSELNGKVYKGVLLKYFMAYLNKICGNCKREYKGHHNSKYCKLCLPKQQKRWSRNSFLNNKEKILRYRKEYDKKNPKKAKCWVIVNHNRKRSKEYGIEPFTSELVMKLFENANWKCEFCGDNKRLTIDHKHSLKNGGSNNESNLWVLCNKCNVSKHDKSVEEWISQGARILNETCDCGSNNIYAKGICKKCYNKKRYYKHKEIMEAKE